MAGTEMFPTDFVNLEFWNKFPRKFNSRKEVDDDEDEDDVDHDSGKEPDQGQPQKRRSSEPNHAQNKKVKISFFSIYNHIYICRILWAELAKSSGAKGYIYLILYIFSLYSNELQPCVLMKMTILCPRPTIALFPISRIKIVLLSLNCSAKRR